MAQVILDVTELDIEVEVEVEGGKVVSLFIGGHEADDWLEEKGIAVARYAETDGEVLDEDGEEIFVGNAAVFMKFENEQDAKCFADQWLEGYEPVESKKA